MSRDSPQFFLFARGQIRFDILGIATQQIKARRDSDEQVDDPCPANVSPFLSQPIAASSLRQRAASRLQRSDVRPDSPPLLQWLPLRKTRGLQRASLRYTAMRYMLWLSSHLGVRILDFSR
jgi:hypothetical protein